MTFQLFINKCTWESLQQCFSSDHIGSVHEVKSHLMKWNKYELYAKMHWYVKPSLKFDCNREALLDWGAIHLIDINASIYCYGDGTFGDLFLYGSFCWPRPKFCSWCNSWDTLLCRLTATSPFLLPLFVDQWQTHNDCIYDVWEIDSQWCSDGEAAIHWTEAAHSTG